MKGAILMFLKKNNTPEERRNKTIKILKKQGILVNTNLPFISSENIKLKSIENVKKRIKASMLAAMYACSINNGEHLGEALMFISAKMGDYGLSIDDFLEKEKRLLQNKEINILDVRDIGWSYEAIYSLLWAVDLISNKELINASKICNTDRAMSILGMITTKGYEDIPKFRSLDEILDMLDLYYCYHWACVEKKIRPDTNIGKLNPDVVVERRKGLEWLISNVVDWNDISLDT